MKKVMLTYYGIKSINSLVQKAFIRVYHSIKYINSSNYSPIRFWEHGIQMVCVNLQTPDAFNSINDAFFKNEQLKSIGYISKEKVFNSLKFRCNLKFEIIP